MKSKIKILTALTTLFVMLCVQTISVAALDSKYEYVDYLTDEELYDYVWDCYASNSIIRTSDNGDYDDVTAFKASMSRYELTLFLDSYERIGADRVLNVKNKFMDYLSEKYENITISKDDSDNIYQINADGSRYDWKYDSADDMFKAYDEDGKFVMSYDRYHPEGAETSSDSSSGSSLSGSSSDDNKTFAAQSVTNPSNTSSSTVSSATTATAVASTSETTAVVVEAVPVTAEATTATADSTDGSSAGLNTWQMILLACVGVAAVVGACVAGKFIGKKKS